RDDGDQDDPADDAADAVPRPRRQLPLLEPLRPPPDLLDPELVVARRVLADQEVDLVDELEARQDEDPVCELHLGPQRVAEPDERVVGHERPDEQEPDRGEQDEPLDPVPQGYVPARQYVFFSGSTALVRESESLLRPLGLLHVGLPTVNDDMTVFMLFWFCE